MYAIFRISSSAGKSVSKSDTIHPRNAHFITGDTSSEKTLIPLIHYLLEKEKNPDYKMLFLVPYCALASQKQTEITELLHRVKPDLYVALSTGECREEDNDIRTRDVDVAVIIYEKAYYFVCNTKGFLQQYQTIVYDEFALSKNDSRRITCDLMLLRRKREIAVCLYGPLPTTIGNIIFTTTILLLFN